MNHADLVRRFVCASCHGDGHIVQTIDAEGRPLRGDDRLVVTCSACRGDGLTKDGRDALDLFAFTTGDLVKITGGRIKQGYPGVVEAMLQPGWYSVSLRDPEDSVLKVYRANLERRDPDPEWLTGGSAVMDTSTS